MEKTLPFTKAQIETVLERHPTPFHVYDEAGIRATVRGLLSAFAWAPGFKEFFAVKATPNPYILEVLREEGLGADCSSLAELILAEKSGITGENIMFSSNDTPAEEYRKARELESIINVDDITHIDFLERTCGMPELVCFRYNPGPLREGNAIIGQPEEAKYGCTRDQLFDAYGRARDLGARRFGLHTMVASNELNPDYFVDTASMLFSLVVDLKRASNIRMEFVNLGGGIGIPYGPEQEPVNLKAMSDGIREAYDRLIKANGLHPLKIFMENGRMITGPHGFLVARVLHLKEIYKNYVGLDACMANLMRPGMYGAYHHVTVPGKEDLARDHTYDVTGSLCENNDKFAIDRKLPKIDVGDLVVIHDTGAHGHAMGFNYNGKLRSAELLLRTDGTFHEIRRAETVRDYFATLDYPGL
jgi:diaminopimelate decarboxylase